MKLRLRATFYDLELEAPCLDAERVRLLDAEAALAQLRPAATNHPMARQGLRSLLLAAGDHAPPQAEAELLARVARLVARCQISLRRRPRSPRPSDSPLRVDLRPAPAPAPAPAPDTDHWIELLLQGESGEPFAGLSCEITLPWGTVVRRTSDRLGLIRLDGLPEAGECIVRFPTLEDEPDASEPEPREWELFETYAEPEAPRPTGDDQAQAQG